MAFVLVCGVLSTSSIGYAADPRDAAASQSDTDQDGLKDALEQALLEQFVPRFFVGQHDCSTQPAAFKPATLAPIVEREDGTIYGQAFPASSSTAEAPEVELHYYHLWKLDCGEHGHPLDAEHVAVLVRASAQDLDTSRWHAVYWYAAAHEQTVCDVSQIARASTLHAVDRGAKVWISPNKHASYLNETLCSRGCGADRCDAMTPLPVARIINLGESGRPMNQAVFAHSNAWPLESKMRITNFPGPALTRLNAMPESEIAWFNPGRHPSQGIIAISASTENALATSGGNTADAISVAGDSTGSALGTTYRATRHALASTARNVSKALRLTPKESSIH